MTHRDLDHHRDPVLPFPSPRAGGLGGDRPVIVTKAGSDGRRISTVRRPDGSTFTVTVPVGGIDAHLSSDDGTGPWITEDGGYGRRSPVALDLLAARVGLRIAANPPVTQ